VKERIDRSRDAEHYRIFHSAEIGREPRQQVAESRTSEEAERQDLQMFEDVGSQIVEDVGTEPS